MGCGGNRPQRSVEWQSALKSAAAADDDTSCTEHNTDTLLWRGARRGGRGKHQTFRCCLHATMTRALLRLRRHNKVAAHTRVWTAISPPQKKTCANDGSTLPPPPPMRALWKARARRRRGVGQRKCTAVCLYSVCAVCVPRRCCVCGCDDTRRRKCAQRR